MKYTSRISATALMAAAGLLSSPAALALGLGDLTVESYLGQPLQARIELLTRENDDLASVTARLGSAEDYELIGASLDDIAVPVRFSVEDADGDAFLQASSRLPVTSPVVRLIVEVNWASGRMLREYTIFLDPPTVSDTAPPPPRIDVRETAAPAPAAPEPVASDSAAPREAPRERSAPDPEPVRSVGGREYGPVASGETLWGIANDWAEGTGLSVNQVMIAIQRENPDAFLRGNINLLKRGAILRLPSSAAVERVSRSDAYRAVVEQEEEFRGVRSAPQPVAETVPLLSEDRVTEAAAESAPAREEETAAEEIVEAAEEIANEIVSELESDAPAAVDTDAVESAAARDQLELVPPSEASELDSSYGFEESSEDVEAGMSVQALRENLARTEEELITREQQNEYLQNRIQELEAELEAAQSAEVADGELAAMQQRLREERLQQQSDAVEKPWWERFGVWLLGLLVLAAAMAAWLFSGRLRAAKRGGTPDTVKEITDEAEDVLRVLEDRPPATPRTQAFEPDPGIEVVYEEAPKTDQAFEGSAKEPAAEEAGEREAESEAAEAETSDPEIQLDLARAYISMGDKEAASVILEEVVNNGNEEQQAEARKMLDLI
ncbi:MAG: FimV/HubP family polar landmark protein [Xanthomonadales bacterium]|jgi:pilus assembly protein FimV|nr:FimV/HubP family polar landmark protein [Xanthomonadales bacterium]